MLEAMLPTMVPGRNIAQELADRQATLRWFVAEAIEAMASEEDGTFVDEFFLDHKSATDTVKHE
jgi:hypothetical protein